MTADTRSAPGPIAVWLRAARPRTLGASLAPVLVGTAVASAEGGLRPGVAALCAATALLLQIAANLMNDAADFERGIDLRRVGPTRVTQAGWLAPGAVRAAAFAFGGVGALLGLALVPIGGLPIAGLGVLALAAALTYSAGPAPLASLGLGEVAAFGFFGLTAVMGTAYLQTGSTSGLAWLCAIPVGALVSELMLVNNLRDRASDAQAGKRTLVVRLGRRRALQVFGALLGIAFASAGIIAARLGSPGPLLAWAALPLARAEWRRVREADGELSWATALKGAAALHAIFSLLLALGIVL